MTHERMEFSPGTEPHLQDESGWQGKACGIGFPQDTQDVIKLFTLAQVQNMPITIQGAKTGICAGAVPMDGYIVNTTRMKKVTAFSFNAQQQKGSITVQAGVTLEELNQILSTKKMDIQHLDALSKESWQTYCGWSGYLWFVPNPTEATATLGGIAATAALGSRGAANSAQVQQYFSSVEIVLQDGTIIHAPKDTSTHELLENFKLDETASVTDTISMFCGSEGILGMITQVQLALEKAPPEMYGLFSYHASYQEMEDFLEKFSSAAKGENTSCILAADWFDAGIPAVLQAASKQMNLGWQPEFPEGAQVALWTELGGDEDNLFELLAQAMEILEEISPYSEETLAATDSRDFQRMAELRHTITEACNLLQNGPDKMQLDWIAPKEKSIQTITGLLNKAREQQLYAFVGHALSGQGTLRILQPSPNQPLQDLFTTILQENHCQCSKEHGIGRIKKALFAKLNPCTAKAYIDAKKSVATRINQGVMVDS